MSDHSHADTLSGANQGTGGAPALSVGNQYVRSVSLNVPDAPAVYASMPARPHIGLVLDVNARQLADRQLTFEVTLVMRARGLTTPPSEENPEPAALYEVEIAYSSLFALPPSEREVLETMLLIDAPRLLFPGARNVLLNLVREAGFPTINIQPVDFVALWQARRKQG